MMMMMMMGMIVTVAVDGEVAFVSAPSKTKKTSSAQPSRPTKSSQYNCNLDDVCAISCRNEEKWQIMLGCKFEFLSRYL